MRAQTFARCCFLCLTAFALNYCRLSSVFALVVDASIANDALTNTADNNNNSPFENKGEDFEDEETAAFNNEVSTASANPGAAEIRFEESFKFTKTFYNVSIPENSQGKTYATVVVPHASVGSPRKQRPTSGAQHFSPYAKMGIYVSDAALTVRYKIISGDDKKIFKAEARRVGDFVFLMIRTRTSETVLNREQLDNYRLVVRATITSNRNEHFRIKTKCEVHVQVEDVNDLIPYFYITDYDVNVPEDIAVDSNLVRVSAFDADAGINGEVYYSLEESSDASVVSKMFAVHPTMGIVTNTRLFTSDTSSEQTGTGKREYRLTILATDRRTNLYKSHKSLYSGMYYVAMSKANLKITVESVNKHPPKLRIEQHSSSSPSPPSLITSQTSKSTSTSSPLDSPLVYAIVRVDDDDGEHSIFGRICSLTIEDGNDLNMFVISNSSTSSKEYYIELKRPYSLSPSMYNATLKASRSGYPRLNPNGFGLEFNLTLKAVDCGGLFTTKSVNVVLNPFSAKSSWNPFSSSSFPIWSIISLLKPTFKKEYYFAEIHEIALIGSEVLHLEVDIPFHSDSNVYIETKLGSLPLVSYSIMNGNYQQVFGITSNGVIFTRKELDFEKQNEYTIVIAAHLRSPVTGAAIMSSSSFSTTQVHIKVIDDNDNDPIFSNQSSKLSFSSPHFASLIFDENKPNGSLLCSVLATDADSGENGFISYAFTNSERIPFAINQETGEIRTTEVIDYEAGAREYFLIVRASDWGIPFRRHSELVINVTIRDTNDHRPQFERKDCTAYIPFKTKPYSEIITLSAIDFDARSLVTYKMASNPPGDDLSNCFELDEITGVLRLKCYLKEYLNSDSPKETYVNVSATDGQHFADVMPIKIVIVETKDALPVTQRKSHRRRATTESILVECKSENVGIIEKIKRHMLRDSNSVVESSSSTSDGKANAQIKSLTVPQINANKPIIHPNIPKVIYIRENIPRGHSFMTLSADDADEGYNGLLIWSLNVNEYEETNMFKTMPFDVDMFSGKLKAIDSIDRETQSKYKLNVTVCDLGSNPGQLCSSRDLEIIVDDDNDNQPKFESSIYYFSVPEDTKSGSTVGRLQAEDIDLSHNSVLTYSLLNHRKYFAVDLATGSLSTREKLDREEVAKYKLHVTVNDNGVPSMSSTATVIIDIIDVNDNAPQFREPHYFARVREDLPIGTVVTKINAFDYDAGSNAKIKYSFRRDGNEDSHFSIDHLMGTIRISKELDFEEKQLYNLTIIAEDHGDPVLSSKVSLLIEVEDVDENEYAPRFSDFVASGSVAENSPLGTYVMTVNALDDDIYSGLPGDRSVVYQLVEGDGLGMFDIDSKGNIYTAAVLDRETNWRYWLTVVAKDKAAVPKSSHTHLFIEVKDENDNAPITVEPFYFVKIEENASIATTIIQLQAYDPDVNGESSEINYRILNDGKDCVFKIDSKTGIIQTKARLDHELQTQYVLDIEISENAIGENGHYLTSKTPVIINVLDVNDNKPQFVHTIFLCQTYNNLKDTIPICQVVAYDADDVGSNQMVANDNGKLSFSIIDDNEFFRIDESSGAIYFKGSGNISKGKYYLIVKAFDNGSPRHSSQAKVLIEVLDSEKEIENENHAPELDSESVDTNIELSENEKIGTLITFIKALDADDDKICSHIVDGNSAGVFASFEGALFVAKRIDYESSQKFVLTIMLTDGIASTYANITIAIVDINDNIPRFLQDLYTINIFENITKETVIFTLEVDDVDIYDNNVFSLYSSGSPQSLNKFTIEQWTGKLRVKESLDHEVCKQHVLIVEAADSSVTTDGISSAKMMKTSPDQSRPTLPPFVSSSHRSFTKIVINVLDVNDHSPKFISTSNEVKIPENSAVGTSVISLLAIDADTGINAEITYSITSGNVNDVFGIDEQLGYIFIQKPLNVKLQPEYYLAVKAIDGGDIPLSSSTNVHIIVTVPDNLPPEFPKREYIIDLKEDAKVGYIITSAVKAISRQSLFYELTEDGEDSPNFGINLNTGEIYLKKSIDYETNPLHKLKVSATNLMGANDSTLVLINVLDVNDNPDHTVIFTQKMYEGSLFENATRGKEVLRVHAASTDIGVNVDVTYQIVSGNEEYTFALDRKNGTLSLWNSVDFESVKEHLLVVKAEDSRIPFLSAETHVKVTVIDVNDNAPQFIQKSYSAVIREDAAVNEKILQVMATDADSFENAELSYFFVDTSDGNNVKRSQYKEFKIDSENGIIYIDAKLDREMVSSYILEVICIDNGKPPLNSTVLVNIEVSDVNDNQPVFEQSNYTVFVQEGSAAGTTVLKFSINDADSSANGGPFNLEIVSGNEDEAFEINKQETALVTSIKFDHLSKTDYRLEIRATDAGTPSLTSTAWITVRVIEEAQYPPVLIEPISISVMSYLDHFPGGILVHLEAADKDPYDKLTFDLPNENDKQLFSIDHEDGTLMALPGLDVGSYRINVSVSDGKFTSFGTVEVEVLLISEETVENSLQIRFGSIKPADFLLIHKKAFIKALRNSLNVRMKDVIILSLQPAKNLRKKRQSEPEADMDLVFAVYKIAFNSQRYHSPSWLRKKILDNQASIEKQVGLKITAVGFDGCNEEPIECKHGECKDEITLDESQVISVTTSKISFVSPQHERHIRCLCHPGFGGKLCETIINECGRTPSPCPAYKECVPVSSPLGYTCQCPFGKTGPLCNNNAKSCHNQQDVSLCYQEVNPISFQGISYARYTLRRSNIETVSLRLKSLQPRASIMHTAGVRDYNVLEIAGGHIQYRFDCGSGEGVIQLGHILVNDGKWHEVIVQRKGNAASITLDGKYRGQGIAPGRHDILNLEGSDLYFGAEVKPRPVSVGGEDIIHGFIGCLDNIRLDNQVLPLHLTSFSNVATLRRLTNIEFGNCGIKPEFPLMCGAKNQCMNDGTCVPLSNGSYECLCPSRYSGKHCEIDLNPCASNPCTNGATCINDLENCPDKVNCYKCNCRAENTGTNCEKLRYCSPNNPCANEGICEETMHGVICRCQRGFHGYYCEHDIDECSSPITVCPPPATCFNLRGSYRCICPLANLNSTLPCSGDNLLTTDKTLFSSPHSDLILLGIIVIIVIIVTLLVVCICLRCHICHKKSRNVPTSAAVYHAVTNNEFCHKNSVTDAVNLNRISKLSNYDMNAMVTYGDQNYQMHPRQRPTSVVDPLNDLTGARNTDSSEVDFENVGQTHLGRDQSDFVQQLRKTNAPPVASISPQIVESSQMPNAENKIQNIDTKTGASSVNKSSPKRSSFSDSDLNVYNNEVNSNNSTNAEGYHWDCSDWAFTEGSNNPISNIMQVSTHEIRDSESNSDNSQIKLLSSQELNTNKEEGSSSYVRDFEDDVESVNEKSAFLFKDVENDLEFADNSLPSSPLKYNSHPDQYLPVFQPNNDNETDASLSEERNKWI